jgi:hypothetical protein
MENVDNRPSFFEFAKEFQMKEEEEKNKIDPDSDYIEIVSNDRRVFRIRKNYVKRSGYLSRDFVGTLTFIYS